MGGKNRTKKATRSARAGRRALTRSTRTTRLSKKGRGQGSWALLRMIPETFFNWRLVRAVLLVLGCVAAGSSIGACAKALWSRLLHSPRLAIAEVVVHTGPRVPDQEVRMLAAISPGDNILGFRLSECVEAIEIHPWVKRASVMRELPDRVVIEIEEREPEAMIALGALYYVDGDGEIFKKVLAGDSLDLPVLTGVSLLEVVEDKEQVDYRVGLGLELIGLARDSRILPLAELSEINLDRAFGATVVRAADAMRIRFGHDQFPDKWTRMERALVELADEAPKVSELDLNYEGRVTVRLRQGFRVAAAEPEPAGGL